MIVSRQLGTLQNRRSVYTKYPPVQIIQRFRLPILLILVHIPLGILMYRFNALATAHAFAVLFAGLYYAVRKHEKMDRVAYIIAYLIGVEILWRMVNSSLLYEFGKYGTVAIMIVALVQRGYWKIPTLPLFYIVLLIPSCFLTIISEGIFDSRKILSSSMSGPIALFVSCWFFSYLRLTPLQLKKLLLTMIIPIISVGVATLFFTVTTEDIQFTTESNDITSGGFGPNQVSAMLGLAAFVCFASYLLFKNKFKETLFLGVLAIFFTMQSVLTFSRGGIYNAIGATAAIIIFQMQNLSQDVRRTIPIMGIGAIFLLLIFPYLDNFTGGKLGERFESSNTTNRMEIMESDFQIFNENPLLGIGAGESKYYREEFLGKAASSHTEFSRILSEHGLFGIIALISLGIGTVYNLKRQKTVVGKALVAGVVMWSFLFMLNAGMRLAAPSFMWGMSFSIIVIPHIKGKKFLRVQKERRLRSNKNEF